LSAVQEVGASYGIPVIAIANLADLIAYLTDSTEFQNHLAAVRDYRLRYGID
jgi:orotate phosphoribosyltransferase